MARLKRFGLSKNLTQGLTDVINAAENNTGSARYEVVALSRIEIDPSNPRNLLITPQDITSGTIGSDRLSFEKRKEVESLLSLADTIKNSGVINPVVVYKYADKYRLLAGERRFLASIMAKKTDIHAKILTEKPDELNLRLLQWIENTERADLSLIDRINNVKAILDEYTKKNTDADINATLIKDLIGVSLSQATAYIAVLTAPEEVKDNIKTGGLNNLDKAAFTAKIQSVGIRHKVIDMFNQGASLKQVKSSIQEKHQVFETDSRNKSTSKKRGRTAKRVNMGSTSSLLAAQKLIQLFLTQPIYERFSQSFSAIKWDQYDDVTRAFKTMVTILEKEDI